ncbi:MAG: deoxyribose-phosphate aldolase [Deltaproteobacteria bacterium]|jgi:deoxyribose-phosphate aldolase|nr:deoxyribose-phosphate aldolase [Deltaproteobacteria bacterium]
MRQTPPPSPAPPKTPSELAQFIDHTLLRADATEAMIQILCKEAMTHGFYAVCVNSGHVGYAKQVLSKLQDSSSDIVKNRDVRVAAVVGFPLGACTTTTKVFETIEAIRIGASEIDMVLRVDLVKTGEFGRVRDDIRAVVGAATKAHQSAVVKVILETGLLTLEEIARSSRAADEAGAHFIKTCTGFSTAGLPAGGATIEHVALMRESAGDHVKIKASGGIRNFEMARGLILAGADRLGTSSGVSLVGSTDTQTNGGSGY